MTKAADELRGISAQLDKLLRRRDTLIRRRRKEGASLRQIADEAGMSYPGVDKILKTAPRFQEEAS